MKKHTLVLKSVDQLYLGPLRFICYYSGTQAEGAAPIWAILMAEDRKQKTEVNPSSALKAHFVLAKRSH